MSPPLKQQGVRAAHGLHAGARSNIYFTPRAEVIIKFEAILLMLPKNAF